MEEKIIMWLIGLTSAFVANIAFHIFVHRCDEKDDFDV